MSECSLAVGLREGSRSEPKWSEAEHSEAAGPVLTQTLGRMLLGAPPPDPLMNRVWGGAPKRSEAEPQRGSGGLAPSYILAAKPPRGLGRSPK